jgi:hypothetical protein
LRSTVGQCYNNIVHGFTGSSGIGIECNNYYNLLSTIYNNTVTNCLTCWWGGTSENQGYEFNNIGVGGTTNWGTRPDDVQGQGYNAGAAGDSPWEVAPYASTAITMATTDFNNYAGDDFTPAAENSPQVCSALDLNSEQLFDVDPVDILGKIRPAYCDKTHSFDYDNEASGPFSTNDKLSWGSGGTAGTGILLVLDDGGTTGNMIIHLTSGVAPTDNEEITNGTATCDVNGTVTEEAANQWVRLEKWTAGAFEYDFGGPQAIVDITLQNVADGSYYQIYDTTNDAEVTSGTQSGTGDIVVSDVPYTGTATLRIRVRKGTSAPYYKAYSTQATMNGENLTIYVSQIPDE